MQHLILLLYVIFSLILSYYEALRSSEYLNDMQGFCVDNS